MMFLKSLKLGHSLSLFASTKLTCNSVVELPHKAAYFAALLALLNANPLRPRSNSPPRASPKPQNGDDVKMENGAEESKPPANINIAHLVIERLLRRLEDALRDEQWLAVRLIVCMLARLTQLPTPIIAIDSFIALVQEFAKYLDSSASFSQRDHVAMIMGEALMLLPANSQSELQSSLAEYGTRSKKARYDTLLDTYTENVSISQSTDEIDLVLAP